MRALLLTLWTTLAPADEAAPADAVVSPLLPLAEVGVTEIAEVTWRGRVRGYLQRPLGGSARFADHGAIRLALVPGSPQLYRIEASVGVLDHLELGATAHWLPGQAKPTWGPIISVAAYRSRRFETGARYFQQLAAPASDPTHMLPRAHYLLGSVAFLQWWYSVGFDLGVAQYGETDRFDELPDVNVIERTGLAAGVFARFGNRRWGITIQGLMPTYSVECMLEVRFNAFGLRAMDRWGQPTNP